MTIHYSTFDLICGAPWSGQLVSEPYIVHAITGAAIIGKAMGYDLVTACQLPGANLVIWPETGGIAQWPLRIAKWPPDTLPAPLRLCETCLHAIEQGTMPGASY